MFFLASFTCFHAAFAGERPYFVTYDQTMEEPGNLEIEAKGLTASPQGGDGFLSGVTEFEYGAKAWWTTEFYLDGQTTANQSTIFTGYRWENRFRLLMHEHMINPVLLRRIRRRQRRRQESAGSRGLRLPIRRA